jgi:hypothetical protein
MAPSTPTYISSAPEARGERAILSNIELVGEVGLSGATLGVFYSHEVYKNGSADNLLFRLKDGGFGASGISAYSLFNAASITSDQANKLLTALDDYISKQPKDLAKDKLYNFELYAGILEPGKEGEYRKFDEVTFILVYSITSKAKNFKTFFPGPNGYAPYDLNESQVKALREMVNNALMRASKPSAKPNV